MSEDETANSPRLPVGKVHMTPGGEVALRAEYEAARAERHRVVEIVAWAAGNGDRSENADYKEGKRRLREIDRRLRYVGHRLQVVEVVDPAAQTRRDRVFFGATVTTLNDRHEAVTVTIVGVDEASLAAGTISVGSPAALALLGARVGDEVSVRTPTGTSSLEILAICYPEPHASSGTTELTSRDTSA